MNKSKLEALIEARGKDFFAIISGEKHLPSSLYSQATPADFNSLLKFFLNVLQQFYVNLKR